MWSANFETLEAAFGTNAVVPLETVDLSNENDAWSLMRFAVPPMSSAPAVSAGALSADGASPDAEDDPWCLLGAVAAMLPTAAAAPSPVRSAVPVSVAPSSSPAAAHGEMAPQTLDEAPTGPAAGVPFPHNSPPADWTPLDAEEDDVHCAVLSVPPLADLMASPPPPSCASWLPCTLERLAATGNPQTDGDAISAHLADPDLSLNRQDIHPSVPPTEQASGAVRAGACNVTVEDATVEGDEEEEEAFALCGCPSRSAATILPSSFDAPPVVHAALPDDDDIYDFPPHDAGEFPPNASYVPSGTCEVPLSSHVRDIVEGLPCAGNFDLAATAPLTHGAVPVLSHGAAAHLIDEDYFVPPAAEDDPFFDADDARDVDHRYTGQIYHSDHWKVSVADGVTPVTNTAGVNYRYYDARDPAPRIVPGAPVPPLPAAASSSRCVPAGGAAVTSCGTVVEVGPVKTEPATMLVPLRRGLIVGSSAGSSSAAAGTRRPRSVSPSSVSEYNVDSDETVYSQCSSTDSGSLVSSEDYTDQEAPIVATFHSARQEMGETRDDPWSLDYFLHSAPGSMLPAAAPHHPNAPVTAGFNRASHLHSAPAVPAFAGLTLAAHDGQVARALDPSQLNVPPFHHPYQGGNVARPAAPAAAAAAVDDEDGADAYRGFRRLRDLNPDDEMTPFAVRFGLTSVRGAAAARGRGRRAGIAPDVPFDAPATAFAAAAAVSAERGRRGRTTTAKRTRRNAAADSSGSDDDGGGGDSTSRGRGKSSGLPRRADGGVYAYSWATARGRRILTYNGTKYAGSKAHKMWGLIKEAESGGGQGGSHRAPAPTRRTATRGRAAAGPAPTTTFAAVDTLEAVLSQQLAQNRGARGGAGRASTTGRAGAAAAAASVYARQPIPTVAAHGPLAEALFGTIRTPGIGVGGPAVSAPAATAPRASRAHGSASGGRGGSDNGGLLQVLGRGPAASQQPARPAAGGMSVFEAAALLRARRAEAASARAVERADAYDAPALDLLPPDLFDDSLRSL